MNSQDIINTLSKGIDMVSQKLGVAANKIYPILLKQAQYQLIMDIITSIIWTIVLIVGSILICNGIKGIQSEKGIVYNSFEKGEGIFGVAYFMITIILIIISVTVLILTIPEIPQIIINPQWFIWTNYVQPLISK